MASADLREELNCSICLEIYTDPVNLRCGHNYCRACIDQVLDDQGTSGVYTCPECRTIYGERPELQRNITLCNIAERFLSAHPAPQETGVFCTYCIQSPVPAVKACIMCEACLCENHLRVHSNSEEHVLIEPGTSLATKKCPIHKRILEYYCAHDQVCFCALCKQDGKHCGHPVEVIYNVANQKKERLKNIFGKLTIKMEEVERNIQSLQKDRKKAEDKVAEIIQMVADVFKEIQDKLQVLEVQVVRDITKELEKNTKPISSIIQQLETQRDEISGKMCHIEELCSMTDPLTVLEEQETNRGDFFYDQKCGYKSCPIPNMDEVLISLQLHKDLTDIVAGARRQLFVPENSDIDLDEDTAAGNVGVSANSKIAYGRQRDDDFEYTDESFASHQVLSSTSFSSGKHYWEVDIHGSKNWRIGMAYGSIAREGEDSVFGNSDESWCISRNYHGYSFQHNGEKTCCNFPQTSNQSKRLGIYLDYEDGRLSFYHLGSQIVHLHTFDTGFMDSLHAAIRVGFNAWVQIIL